MIVPISFSKMSDSEIDRYMDGRIEQDVDTYRTEVLRRYVSEKFKREIADYSGWLLDCSDEEFKDCAPRLFVMKTIADVYNLMANPNLTHLWSESAFLETAVPLNKVELELLAMAKSPLKTIADGFGHFPVKYDPKVFSDGDVNTEDVPSYDEACAILNKELSDYRDVFFARNRSYILKNWERYQDHENGLSAFYHYPVENMTPYLLFQFTGRNDNLAYLNLIFCSIDRKKIEAELHNFGK